MDEKNKAINDWIQSQRTARPVTREKGTVDLVAWLQQALEGSSAIRMHATRSTMPSGKLPTIVQGLLGDVDGDQWSKLNAEQQLGQKNDKLSFF